MPKKVFGKDVVVIPKKLDTYSSTVGHVIVDGRDVDLEMLEEGMAWHYEEFDHNKRLREAKQSARAAAEGLGCTGGPPWDWRAGKKRDNHEGVMHKPVHAASLQHANEAKGIDAIRNTPWMHSSALS